jgi:hypothetical protein
MGIEDMRPDILEVYLSDIGHMNKRVRNSGVYGSRFNRINGGGLSKRRMYSGILTDDDEKFLAKIARQRGDNGKRGELVRE